MNKNTHCYIGTQPGCGCLGIVCVDMKDLPKETAKSVADMVRNGLEVQRIPIDEYREKVVGMNFGCAHRFKMKTCLQKGMNVPGVKPEQELEI